MSMSEEQAEKPIPPSLIKRQLVQYAGKAHLIANTKLARTNDHQVHFAFEILPFGKDLRNPRVFWTGPISSIKATESDIFKGGSESLFFTWSVDPMEVLFVQNQFVSAWGDGIECIKKGYIQMSPNDNAEVFLANKDRQWSYRFVVAAKNYDEFQVILETVPTTLQVLKGCPWAESISTGGCEIDRWEATPAQTLSSEYGPGILPFLQDDRLPKYQKECLLPSSDTIRLKMHETLSTMGTTADLEEGDFVGYNPAKKRNPPVFPEIPLIKDPKKGTKRKIGDSVSTEKSGNLDKMKVLLDGALGGHMTVDERKALGLNNEEEDEVSADKGPKQQGVLDTPASINLDVSSFMSKLPPGISRDSVRHMSFKNIETAIKLSENMGVEERAEALYRSVTMTKMIPEHEDNRFDILHPARYFPGSMAEPAKYWGDVPLRVEPHVTGIPLTHVGLENTVAPLAIEKAGDRGNRLYIRYFMQANVNVQQKAPKFQTHRADSGAIGFSSEENWKEATKVSQIKDAVFAYMFIMADLHCRDYGPRNFALKQVIDGVLGRYHYLAVQKKPPLSYKELQDFVTATLSGLGGATKAPDTLPQMRKDEVKTFSGYDSRGRGRGRGAPAATAVSSRSESLPTCYQYNSPTGCPRAPGARMCHIKSGKMLLHLCSQTNGKGDPCLAPHAKHEHK